jgi:hypothetical protein
MAKFPGCFIKKVCLAAGRMQIQAMIAKESRIRPVLANFQAIPMITIHHPKAIIDGSIVSRKLLVVTSTSHSQCMAIRYIAIHTSDGPPCRISVPKPVPVTNDLG